MLRIDTSADSLDLTLLPKFESDIGHLLFIEACFFCKTSAINTFL